MNKSKEVTRFLFFWGEYGVLQSSVKKSRLLQNAIDSRMRIKTSLEHQRLRKLSGSGNPGVFLPRYEFCL
jgi:hypothetical protein